MEGAHGRWGPRLAVAALCVLLTLSVATRVLISSGAPTERGPADSARAVDLGEGVVLSDAAVAARDVLIGACWTPIPVEFVEPSPHGTDTSVAGPTNAEDRVFYAFHGWVFGGRFATVELIIRHLIWRGVSILRLEGIGGRDTLAVRLTIPTGCGAEPEQAMAALRSEVKAGR